MENRRDSSEGDDMDEFLRYLYDDEISLPESLPDSDSMVTDPVIDALTSLLANINTEAPSSSASSSGNQENYRALGSSRVSKSRRVLSSNPRLSVEQALLNVSLPPPNRSSETRNDTAAHLGRGRPLSPVMRGNDSMQWQLNAQTRVEAKRRYAKGKKMTKVPSPSSSSSASPPPSSSSSVVAVAAATAGVQEQNMAINSGSVRMSPQLSNINLTNPVDEAPRTQEEASDVYSAESEKRMKLRKME